MAEPKSFDEGISIRVPLAKLKDLMAMLKTEKLDNAFLKGVPSLAIDTTSLDVEADPSLEALSLGPAAALPDMFRKLRRVIPPGVAKQQYVVIDSALLNYTRRFLYDRKVGERQEMARLMLEKEPGQVEC